MQNHRAHPSVTIPQRSRSPVYHPPEVYSPYPFEAGSQSSDSLLSAWDATPTARRPSTTLEVPDRPLSRARSTFSTPTVSPPQPEIHRSASQRLPIHANKHRSSKSETLLNGRSPEDDYVARSYTPATPGPAPSFEISPSRSTDEPDSRVNKLTRELSNMTLQSEEGLKRFQKGSLDEKDEAWHSLVPNEAREALGKHEVERQCVLFEIFKSERDYVYDLHVIREVFVEPLKSALPPIISPGERLQTFLSTVFWNLEQITTHHERLMEDLFARQREQHPLVQSVCDVILESFFQFKLDYESYIEHYPLAEQRHRTELNHNQAYQDFVQRCSRDPRTKKRDLVTFLSRPVTRLPRVNLILEHLQKRTESDHPDAQDLPVVLGVLNDFLKSTQPGIAAAESKVKFWNLCDSLAFNKGEIIELALYNDTRCLVYAGTLARRSKSEMDWNPWYDLHVALLDNFLLITKEEKLPGDAIRRLVVSRPIPLAYLRLGSFDDPPENRKERPEDGSFLRVSYRPMYPFTVYHAFEKATRRYTLYASTEAARTKWYEVLVNTKAVEDARREGNRFFVPQVVDDGTFRVPGPRSGRSRKHPSGRVVHAVSFIASGGKRFMAFGCASGIYIGRRGETFRKILSYENAKNIIVLQDFNKVLIHHDGYLLSYSLEVLARVVQYQSPARALDASLETIAGQDGPVICCHAGKVKDRTIVVYAVKAFLHTNVYALEVCRPSDSGIRPPWNLQFPTLSFRPYGEYFYLPQDPYSIMTLTKTIAVAMERGIAIADPQNAGKTVISIIPDFSGAPSNSAMGDLKAHCEASRPLGIVPCDISELMVIYDTMGCYVTKHGRPSRDSSFVRWEIKADSFLHRAPHILLFCSEFIEIRDVQSGRLDQVIEGADIRLLYAPTVRSALPLVAWRGGKDDDDGLSEQIVELIDTAEIKPVTPGSGVVVPPDVWDEWEM